MEEAGKVAIRNVRRDYNDDIKKLELPEDAEKEALADVQKLTDNKIVQVEKVSAQKSQELMQI
jgi:ribosome recycling factor